MADRPVLKFERKEDFLNFKNAHYDKLNKIFYGDEDIDGLLLAIFNYGQEQFEAGVESKIDDSEIKQS